MRMNKLLGKMHQLSMSQFCSQWWLCMFPVFLQYYLFVFSVYSQSMLPDAIAGVVHNVPALDTQWIETTAKKAALKLEKLDTDLKNYKSNSIKESIRWGDTSTAHAFSLCFHLHVALSRSIYLALSPGAPLLPPFLPISSLSLSKCVQLFMLYKLAPFMFTL